MNIANFVKKYFYPIHNAPLYSIYALVYYNEIFYVDISKDNKKILIYKKKINSKLDRILESKGGIEDFNNIKLEIDVDKDILGILRKAIYFTEESHYSNNIRKEYKTYITNTKFIIGRMNVKKAKKLLTRAKLLAKDFSKKYNSCDLLTMIDVASLIIKALEKKEGNPIELYFKYADFRNPITNEVYGGKVWNICKNKKEEECFEELYKYLDEKRKNGTLEPMYFYQSTYDHTNEIYSGNYDFHIHYDGIWWVGFHDFTYNSDYAMKFQEELINANLGIIVSDLDFLYNQYINPEPKELSWEGLHFYVPKYAIPIMPNISVLTDDGLKEYEKMRKKKIRNSFKT